MSSDQMNALVYENYGDAAVMSVAKRPRPSPAAGEIQVRVRAVEITKTDCELRSFRFSVLWFWLPLRLAVGLFRPRRQILGVYFSGTVTALGEGVPDFRVGDAVLGTTNLRMGACAEYVCLPSANTLVKKPSSLSFEKAAALPLGGLNALHFMRLANIQPGERLLIIGAGGSIGVYAVQIAKAMGARVTAVDAPHKLAMLTALGADQVIDYTSETVTDSQWRFDIVFDMVPSTPYGAALSLLNPGGRYLLGNPRLVSMLRCLLGRPGNGVQVRCRFARETREELQDLLGMVSAGAVQVVLDRVLPLDDAVKGHQLVETERRVGHVVLSLATGS